MPRPSRSSFGSMDYHQGSGPSWEPALTREELLAIREDVPEGAPVLQAVKRRGAGVDL